MSRPRAAIDCGTNTIRLLIGALPEVVVRTTRTVRLGEGVDRTGRLAPRALERTFAAIDEYAALITQHGAEQVRFCATSATRDAANAADFADGVRARLGVDPEVLSGPAEAALSFAGAVRHLAVEPARPVLVFDVGGGSTELVVGDLAPESADSMDVGSVRLHERHVRHDPPTEAEVAAVTADVDAALDASPVDLGSAATAVGVSGTVTTLAAHVLGLTSYDAAVIDQSVLDVDDVHAAVLDLVGRTVSERLALPYVGAGRADVIDAGALIVSRVLRRTRLSSLVVSEADILDGIAWSMVDT